MPKQIQQTQHHPERSQANLAPKPDEAAVVGGQELSWPMTDRPKLAAQGIARLQRQVGNRAVGTLLQTPTPIHSTDGRQATQHVQRVIRPSAGAKPYTAPEEVISAHPTGDTQPTSLSRSILSKLIAANETEIDIDASKYANWEAIVKAHEHLVATETPSPEKDTTTSPAKTTTATVTHDDVEYLLDDNFLPMVLFEESKAALVWKLKGWNGNTWEDGKIFYTKDDEQTSPLLPLPADRINDYWDQRYPSPFKRIRGPDWRANCADYAIGQTFDDVPAAKSFLASSWRKKGSYTGNIYQKP